MPDSDRRGAHDPKNSLCVVAAEALFLALPFVVIALALFARGDISQFAYRPEWALAASAMIGMSLVRFAAGLLQAKIRLESLAWERVMLLFALVIIFALMPSLVVLLLVLNAPAPSGWLAAAQLGLFALGLGLFMCLGWTTQHLRSDETAEEQRREFTVIEGARASGD